MDDYLKGKDVWNDSIRYSKGKISIFIPLIVVAVLIAISMTDFYVRKVLSPMVYDEGVASEGFCAVVPVSQTELDSASFARCVTAIGNHVSCFIVSNDSIKQALISQKIEQERIIKNSDIEWGLDAIYGKNILLISDSYKNEKLAYPYCNEKYIKFINVDNRLSAWENLVRTKTSHLSMIFD